MKLPWEKEEKKEKKEEEDDIELKPKDVKAKLDTIDTLKTTVDGFGKKLETLDAVAEYIKEQREKEKKTVVDKTKKEKEVKDQEEEENIQALFLDDPVKAVQELIKKNNNQTVSPLMRMTINNQAKSLAKDHFTDNPAFELYSDPAFRAEVDKNILSLGLEAQLNPSNMENCYYVVEGKFKKEIKEGKIKARFAAASTSALGTGAEGDKKEIVMTADMKKAAAMFGMSEKEYGEKFQKEHSIV